MFARSVTFPFFDTNLTLADHSTQPYVVGMIFLWLALTQLIIFRSLLLGKIWGCVISMVTSLGLGIFFFTQGHYGGALLLEGICLLSFIYLKQKIQEHSEGYVPPCTQERPGIGMFLTWMVIGIYVMPKLYSLGLDLYLQEANTYLIIVLLLSGLYVFLTISAFFSYFFCDNWSIKFIFFMFLTLSGCYIIPQLYLTDYADKVEDAFMDLVPVMKE